MRDIARRLIREERSRRRAAGEPAGHAALRVCARLRGPLSSLVGLVGFRSLVSRAQALAKAEAAWLGGLQVAPDGSVDLPAAAGAPVSEAKGLEGAVALITQLLDLLVMFIGEALTLQLVQDAWPKVAFKNLTKDPP